MVLPVPVAGDTGHVAAHDTVAGILNDPATNWPQGNATYVPMIGPSNGADDTTALNAALAAGGMLRATPGATYKVSAALAVVSGTTLDLSGATIQAIGAVSGAILGGTGLSNVTVIGGVIDGQSPTFNSGAGIRFVNGAHVTVRGVRVVNSHDQGIYLNNCTDSAVLDCQVEGSGNGNVASTAGQQAGIAAHGARLRIVGNRVTAANDSGITCSTGAATDVTITGNVVNAPTFIGIAAGATRCTVTGNVVNGAVSNGIDSGAATDVTITGNVVYNCAAGIYEDFSASVAGTHASNTIANNSVDTTTSAGGQGIAVAGPVGGTGVTGVTITGNTVQTCYLDGIMLVNVWYSVVSNNAIRNCATAGAATAAGISVRGSSARNQIHHNEIADGANMIGLDIHDATTDHNDYAYNDLSNAGFVINNGPSANDAMRHNRGYNPKGHAVTQPAVPASTVAQTNTTGSDCTVFVTGGTVTVVAIGGTATGLTAGSFLVPAGQTITLTYSVAPTWQWFGL